MNFIEDTKQVIKKSVNNQFEDLSASIAPQRFDPRTFPTRTRIKRFLLSWKSKRNAHKKIEDFNDLDYLYRLLKTDYSKSILLDIVCYQLLNPQKIRLAHTYCKDFFKFKEQVELKQIDTNFLPHSGTVNDWLPKFYQYDLAHMNIPPMFSDPFGLYLMFIAELYRCKEAGIVAEEGDVVIDAGGFYGETALYFANLIGEGGKVFTFEFIKWNISNVQKNLALNPKLSKRIHLAENPISNKSGQKIFSADNGPGSQVSLENRDPSRDQVYYTVSIDDFVKDNNLSKMDFIKMDIEGSELSALQGATQTLKKFTPKLAISVYHKPDDMIVIPKFINDLNLGYEFYLDHYTPWLEETFLYAKVP